MYFCIHYAELVLKLKIPSPYAFKRYSVRILVLATLLTTLYGSGFSSTATATPASRIHQAAHAIKRINLKLVPVSNLTGATALATRANDQTLFVARQSGQIVAITKGQTAPKVILDLSDRLTAGGEQGLLGLAFSPDGAKLYVHYSGLSGETIIEEFAYKNKAVDLSSGRILLTVPQPQGNHNGGQITFGPDGMLYIGLGDGGASNDEGDGHAPEGNGQSRKTLLGKILRIDPNPNGNNPYSIPPDNPFVGGNDRPEIFITGLRNPWRFSFDPPTNSLWIADVGQGRVEEITRLELPDAYGANLGWPVYEGSTALGEETLSTTVKPDIEMMHDDGNCSVTGGYVYRGKQIPKLNGVYLFSGFCNETIYGVRIKSNGKVSPPTDLKISSEKISSFGEDNQGNIYVLSLSKGIFRIAPAE